MRQNTPSRTPETPSVTRSPESRGMDGSRILALIAAAKLALVGAGCGIFPGPGPDRRPEDRSDQPDVCERLPFPEVGVQGIEVIQGGTGLRVDLNIDYDAECDSPTCQIDGVILGAGGGRRVTLSDRRRVPPGLSSITVSFPPGLAELVIVLKSQSGATRDISVPAPQ